MSSMHIPLARNRENAKRTEARSFHLSSVSVTKTINKSDFFVVKRAKKVDSVMNHLKIISEENGKGNCFIDTTLFSGSICRPCVW